MKNINQYTQDNAFSPIFPAGNLGHAYIISGGDEQLRISLANTLASAIVCSGGDMRPCGTCSQCRKSFRGIHPDITKVEKPKDKASIPVDTVREMCADALVVPNDADAKVYIIPAAGELMPPAQNAMLKTLEEPPKGVAFILCVDNPGMMLDTVRSRCVEINLTPPEHTDDKMLAHTDAFFAAIEQGEMAVCEFSFALDKLDRFQLADFLTAAKYRAVELLRKSQTDAPASSLSSKQLMKTVDVLDKAISYTEVNVSNVHVAGFLSAALTDK